MTIPRKGDRFTVTPHRLPHGPRCGRWHCEVTGSVFDDNMVTVQEIKPVAGRWERGMSTCVFISALIPLDHDVDLFGDPVEKRKTRPARGS